MSLALWIPVLCGLEAALSWGAADFAGGMAAKRTSPLGVVIFGQGFGLLLLLGLLLFFPEPIPGWDVWLWGGLAGVGGGLGLTLFYRALADDRMSLVAPLSAVVAMIIPLPIGMLQDGLPAPLTLAGFALALAAVWLISAQVGPGSQLRRLARPLSAGVLFSLFFIGMHQASQVSLLWPIVASRLTSIPSVLAFALLGRRPWRPAEGSWKFVLLSGVLDVAGNAGFILAGRYGRLDVAAVLGSLYPGVTVALAGLFLKEAIGRRQVVGVLMALAAILLIAL